MATGDSVLKLIHHSDLADVLFDIIPSSHVDDVVVVDSSDESYSGG